VDARGRAAADLPAEPAAAAPSKEKPPAIAGELSAESGAATKFTAAAEAERHVRDDHGAKWASSAPTRGCGSRRRCRTCRTSRWCRSAHPGGWWRRRASSRIVDFKGERVLFKRNDHPSPLIYMANTYLTMPDVGDYVIEAASTARQVRSDMPDIGIGACRYTLLLAATTRSAPGHLGGGHDRSASRRRCRWRGSRASGIA